MLSAVVDAAAAADLDEAAAELADAAEATEEAEAAEEADAEALEALAREACTADCCAATKDAWAAEDFDADEAARAAATRDAFALAAATNPARVRDFATAPAIVDCFEAAVAAFDVCATVGEGKTDVVAVDIATSPGAEVPAELAKAVTEIVWLRGAEGKLVCAGDVQPAVNTSVTAANAEPTSLRRSAPAPAWMSFRGESRPISRALLTTIETWLNIVPHRPLTSGKHPDRSSGSLSCPNGYIFR